MADNKPSIFEQLSKGIADAVADIREKVVEEPWFGRTVTEREDFGQWPQANEPQAVQQPEGLTGDILPPEKSQEREATDYSRIDHGFVINNDVGQWPQAEEKPSFLSIEHTRDKNREQAPDKDMDIDR